MESSWEESVKKKNYGLIFIIVGVFLVVAVFVFNNTLLNEKTASENKTENPLSVEDSNKKMLPYDSVSSETSSVKTTSHASPYVSVPNIRCFNKYLNSDIELSVRVFFSDTSRRREVLLYRDEFAVISNRILYDSRVENIKTSKLESKLKREINTLQTDFKIDSVSIIFIRPVLKG